MTLGLMLRLNLILLALFGLLIATEQLLPQAEPDMAPYEQLFMTSDACETPCLMGVRSGMLLDDAVAMLSQNDWVERIYSQRVSQFDSVASWIWSGKQPDFIDPNRRGTIYARSGRSHDIRQLVYQVEVTTTLRFQDLYLGLGETNEGYVQYWPLLDMVTYDVRYRSSDDPIHISLLTRIDCPAYLPNFYWLSETSISQMTGMPLDQYLAPQDLTAFCRSAGDTP